MSYTIEMLSTLLVPFRHYKYLLLQLTQREIKARYKQSFVGYAWVAFNPLAQLTVYSFVFSVVIRFATEHVPYVLFLFAGLLPWTLFQGSLAISTQSLVENAGLLRKVSFPREVIIYAILLAKLLDFAVSALFFTGLFIYLRAPIHPEIWLLIPIFIAQFLFTAGVGLVLATANLFYRDVQYLANLLLMLWMYMTPIVYPLSMVPAKYLSVYSLNPMVGIMEGYRHALFGTALNLPILYWSFGVSLVVFTLGYMFFKKSERTFADMV